jgi:MFS-type transporter involved in bile tolerance (Atg22 family)
MFVWKKGKSDDDCLSAYEPSRLDPILEVSRLGWTTGDLDSILVFLGVKGGFFPQRSKEDHTAHRVYLLN